MNVFLFLVSFVFNILRWDILIRFKKIFDSKNVYNFLNKYIIKMTEDTFRLLKIFTNISFNIDIPEKLTLPEKFIIICNHQSLIDIPFIFYALPHHTVKFVARKSLSKYIPLISLCLRTGRHATINQRKGFRETKRELTKLSNLTFKDNVCPLIFPEGTRSKTGKLGKFHSAAFRILCKNTEMPVLCIALDGGYKLSRLYNVFNLSSEVNLKLKFVSIDAHPESKEETDELLTKLHMRIESQLNSWKDNES